MFSPPAPRAGRGSPLSAPGISGSRLSTCLCGPAGGRFPGSAAGAGCAAGRESRSGSGYRAAPAVGMTPHRYRELNPAGDILLRRLEWDR